MGELPAEVYWRRRVVTVAFVVLAILVLYYLVRSLFASGGEAGPGPSSSPSPSVTVSTAATVDLGAIRPCDSADLVIVLTATTHDWPSTTEPTFDAQVTHEGTTQCVLDTGASDLELLVTSGPDRVWSNRDCETEPLLPAEQSLLRPGDTTVLSVTWPRIRSNDVCSTTLPDPQAGTYRAILAIQGIASDQAVFALVD